MTLPHTTGMITLTNGSTLITGTGTDWQTAGIVGGMVFPTAIGNVLPIAAVNSNTQMVAAVPWTGPTVSTQYALVRDTAYLQQLTENAALLTTVIRELRYSSLAALAAIAPTMGADKLPFATSGNAMAWTALSAFGRTLLGTADAKALAGTAQSVRRSGGANMSSTNDIIYGIEVGTGVLTAQVDNTPFGRVWNDYYATTQGGASDIRSKIGAFSTSGGTINGNVTSTGNISAQAGLVAKNLHALGPANDDNGYYWQTGTVGGAASSRWALYKAGYGVGEPGSNQGANLNLNRYDDNGAYLGTPLIFHRRYGIVEARETPLSACQPGAGVQSLTAGQHIGVLDANTGPYFNRGGGGSSLSIGGNPGLNGRAVHIGVSGWYKTTIGVTALGQGGVVALGRNGSPHMFLYIASNSWGTYGKTALLYITANEYFSWCCVANGVNGNIEFSRENSVVIFEFIQF